MVINVRVIHKAKKNLVKESGSGLRVYVTSPPEKGKANVAVIEQLSRYLKVKKYDINIIAGQHSRHKVIEIPNR